MGGGGGGVTEDASISDIKYTWIWLIWHKEQKLPLFTYIVL